MTLKEIIKQLEFCKFECEAGSLENNIAFIELKKLANISEECFIVCHEQDGEVFSYSIHPKLQM